MFGNEPLRVTKLTGKYTLNRKLLQCVTRTASIAESVFYQGSSEAPQIVSIPVEDIKFKAVIPGSIGELILDRVCGLYANKSR